MQRVEGGGITSTAMITNAGGYMFSAMTTIAGGWGLTFTATAGQGVDFAATDHQCREGVVTFFGRMCVLEGGINSTDTSVGGYYFSH